MTDKSVAELDAELDAALLAGKPTEKIIAAREAAVYREDEAERIQQLAESDARAATNARIEANARKVSEDILSRVRSVLEEPGQKAVVEAILASIMTALPDDVQPDAIRQQIRDALAITIADNDAAMIWNAALALAEADDRIEQAQAALIPLQEKATQADEALAKQRALGSARVEQMVAGGQYHHISDPILSDLIGRGEKLAAAGNAALSEARKHMAALCAARRNAADALSKAETRVTHDTRMPRIIEREGLLCADLEANRREMDRMNLHLDHIIPRALLKEITDRDRDCPGLVAAERTWRFAAVHA